MGMSRGPSPAAVLRLTPLTGPLSLTSLLRETGTVLPTSRVS